MLVYIAGPYTGKDYDAVEANIQTAENIAGELWIKGHAVICPHANTAHFEKKYPAINYDDYLRGDFDIISRCDALVLTTNWETSSGAIRERELAWKLDIPIYVYPDLPDPHPTEVRCPNQSRQFLQIVMQMYRTHLRKNADYSPANILATGEIGLVTRLWDKIARLMNLSGFVFDIREAGKYESPHEPKNESIEDTLMDAAVYAVIGLLLRKGMWGK